MIWKSRYNVHLQALDWLTNIVFSRLSICCARVSDYCLTPNG